MIIHKSAVVACAALFGVAACGTTPATYAPTTQNIQIPAGYSVTLNSPSSLTLSDGVNDYALTRFSVDTKGDYSYFGAGAGRDVYRNSDGSAILAKNGFIYGDPMGAILVRLEDTTLPDAGTATYTGNSVAVLITSGISSSEGEVTLNVSFTDNTIDGLIESRTNFQSSSSSKGDIILNPGTISNGGFSGTTTGVFFGGSTAGTYSGLFTGGSGETLVGEWHYDDGSNQVQGVFSAEQTP